MVHRQVVTKSGKNLEQLTAGLCFGHQTILFLLVKDNILRSRISDTEGTKSDFVE